MSTATRQVHRFTLALSTPPGELSDAELDRLYEAGCDDALIGAVDDDWSARFSREAPSLAEAVVSAVRDIEAAAVEGLGAEGVKTNGPVPAEEAEVVACLDALLKARRLAPRSPEVRALAGRMLAEMVVGP